MTWPGQGQHGDLFDPDNRDFIETVTHETWLNFAVEEFAAQWYSIDYDDEGELRAFLETIEGGPIARLLRKARETSGSIGGDLRKDAVDMARGSTPQSVGLSVVQPGQAPQSVPVTEAAPPKRVFGRR